MSDPQIVPGFEMLPSDGTNALFDQLPLRDWPEQLPAPSDGRQLHLVARDGQLLHEPAARYRLGESHLPIAPYREHIVDTVREHQSTVISAETGSGKSSQLGLYLLEAGASRVFVIQPRILAARELMQRARQNLGSEHEHLAGYLTGTKADSDCPSNARLIYITDHLLFKKMVRGDIGEGDHIIFDEMHEESPASVVALALAQEKVMEYPAMRVIVCSATIDTERYAGYLQDPTAQPVPVMKLPGRTFPIERRETDKDVGQIMRQYIQERKNVIGFEPGITRMKRTASIAASYLRHDKVHLLYADQSPVEQKASLDPAAGNHVVTNKTGETSITPPNKQVAVDSGLSNLGSFDAGKKVLSTVFSSRAAMEQRAGRVGRMEPGTAIIATPADVPPPPAYEDRPERDPSPIQNSDVTAFMAELLSVGRKLEDLDLLDMPGEANITYGYKVLGRIGAIVLVGEQIALTETGKAMNDLPVDPPLARMVVETRSLANEEGAEGEGLRLQVAAATAVLTAKSMLNATQGSHRRYAHPKPHQEKLSVEYSSDVLFELDVFTWLYQKQRQLIDKATPDAAEQFEKLLNSYDILPNRYYKAVRTYEELCLRERLAPADLRKATAVQRNYIIGSQMAGAAEVFVQRGKRMHYDIRGERRTLGRRSTIDPKLGSLVVGTAFDLNMLTARGRTRKQFVTDASVVTLEQIRRYAPSRLTEQDLGYMVSRHGSLMKRKAYYFDNELRIGEFEEALPATIETREALITAMMTGQAPGPNGPTVFRPGTPKAAAAIKIWQAAQSLEQNSPVMLKTEERHRKLIRRVVRESLQYLPLEVTDVAELDTVIPHVYRRALVKPTRHGDIPKLLRESPDGITIHVGGDEERYVEVQYKRVRHDGSTVAHIWIPRELRFAISRQDFAGLEQYHNVKLRIGSGKIMQLDTAFEVIDKERVSMEANRKRREERRQQVAAVALDVMSSPAIERERPPKQDDKSSRLGAKRVKDSARMIRVKPPTNIRKRKKYDTRAAELGVAT